MEWMLQSLELLWLLEFFLASMEVLSLYLVLLQPSMDFLIEITAAANGSWNSCLLELLLISS